MLYESTWKLELVSMRLVQVQTSWRNLAHFGFSNVHCNKRDGSIQHNVVGFWHADCHHGTGQHYCGGKPEP